MLSKILAAWIPCQGSNQGPAQGTKRSSLLIADSTSQHGIQGSTKKLKEHFTRTFESITEKDIYIVKPDIMNLYMDALILATGFERSDIYKSLRNKTNVQNLIPQINVLYSFFLLDKKKLLDNVFENWKSAHLPPNSTQTLLTLDTKKGQYCLKGVNGQNTKTEIYFPVNGFEFECKSILEQLNIAYDQCLDQISLDQKLFEQYLSGFEKCDPTLALYLPKSKEEFKKSFKLPTFNPTQIFTIRSFYHIGSHGYLSYHYSVENFEKEIVTYVTDMKNSYEEKLRAQEAKIEELKLQLQGKNTTSSPSSHVGYQAFISELKGTTDRLEKHLLDIKTQLDETKTAVQSGSILFNQLPEY